MWKIGGKVSYFSLLKTKGSASFSFASRSASDSRRLKVKLAVGSVYSETKKMTPSAWPYQRLAFKWHKSIPHVVLHLLFLSIGWFGAELARPALYCDHKIPSDAENLFLRPMKDNYQKQHSF